MNCRPPATGPPMPSLNGGEHLGQRAAGGVEHDSRAQHAHAHAQFGGGGRLALPLHAHPGQEVAAGRRVLVQRLLVRGP